MLNNRSGLLLFPDYAILNKIKPADSFARIYGYARDSISECLVTCGSATLLFHDIKLNFHKEGSMHVNESAENYLETILILGKKRPAVRSVDIAEELGFKK